MDMRVMVGMNENKLLKRQLNWFGYILRMESEDTGKKLQEKYRRE